MAEPGTSEPRQRTRSTASVDVPSGALAPILRAILQHNDQIVEQNQAILQLLNYHVQSLSDDAKRQQNQIAAKDIHRLSSQRTAVASQRAEKVSLRGLDNEEVPPIPARFVELKDVRPRPSMWDAILDDLSSKSADFSTLR